VAISIVLDITVLVVAFVPEVATAEETILPTAIPEAYSEVKLSFIILQAVCHVKC